MALAKAIKGAVHTPQTITWQDASGTAWDLTGGTITGKIINIVPGSTMRAITGTLVFVTDGSDGKFNWTYSVADVATAGIYKVQFICTYTDATYDLTKMEVLEILEAI